MDIIRKVAEEKIREAMEKGLFDNLPGSGKPLKLDDDSRVPDDLRVAYRILKNSGHLPPELELRKEIITLQRLIGSLKDGEEKSNRLKELNLKILRFNIMRKTPLNLDDPIYKEKLLKRFSG